MDTTHDSTITSFRVDIPQAAFHAILNWTAMLGNEEGRK